MQINALKVSEVVRLAKDHIESKFFNLWIEGEIGDLTDRTHFYFVLKDELATLKSIMYRSMRRFLRFPLKTGMKVICRGKLSIYEPRGEFQLIVDEVIPKGLGELQLAFEELKRKLEAEGLFDEKRKKPLPLWIERVALITSLTGAAIRDVVVNMLQHAPWVKISIYPVRVQGNTAAHEIARALDDLNRLKGFDIIVLARGGGSLQDLWAFNEEIVARAIGRSKIPVVSAIGHERDYTIADFVADKRVSTPTASAKILVSLQQLLQQYMSPLVNISQILQERIEQRQMQILAAKRRLHQIDIIKRKKEILKRLQNNLEYFHPKNKIARLEQETSRLYRGLVERMASFVDNKSSMLTTMHSRLNDLSPLAVLSRGYSIVLKKDEIKVVRNFTDVDKGEKVDVALAKGGLVCEVIDKASDFPKQLPRGSNNRDER